MWGVEDGDVFNNDKQIRKDVSFLRENRGQSMFQKAVKHLD